MRLIRDTWLPDADRHFEAFLRRGAYQAAVRELAVSRCRQYRTAVDVGAHVGLWSRELVHDFRRVVAFEPVQENADCLKRNLVEATTGRAKYWVVRCALSDVDGGTLRLTQVRAGNSGTWSVADNGLAVGCATLDSYAFGDVDLLKIDTECSELAVLRGARETLRRCRPVVCVELRSVPELREAGFVPRYNVDEVHSLLYDLGYQLAGSVSADHVFVPTARERGDA